MRRQTVRVGGADVAVEFWPLDQSEGPARRDGTGYIVTVGTLRVGRVWQETVYRQPSYLRLGVKRVDRTAGATTKIARTIWAHDLDSIGGHDTRTDAVADLVRRWRESRA